MMFRTVLAVLAFSVAASASTLTVFTPTGALDASGNPVDASATVTTGANGAVTVSLTNLQSNISAADQLLSDFFFTLGSTPVSVNSTAATSGQLADLNANGTFTAVAGTPTAWTLTDIGGQVHLNSLTNGPSETIIGTASSNPNASLLGNHNPYIEGTANFSFTIANVTSTTVISNGIFSFGTDAGNNITGSCTTGVGVQCTSSTVPEPITSGLVGTGLMALFSLRRRVRG
jgi:hypothetical protein